MTEQEEVPYARPYWDADEETLLLQALRSGTWTNGPMLREFEGELSRLTGAETVALSSGTAAVHALLHTLGSGRDGPALLITPSLTFAAAPAAAALLGWDVALADVDEDSLTLSPASVAELLERTRGDYALTVVMPVHYAGHTADLAALGALCARHGAVLAEDACHAAGACYEDAVTPVGSWPGSRAAYFSFHPVKPVATGEGGAVSSTDNGLVERLRAYRNHSMTPLPSHEGDLAPWPYTVREPGANHRLSELHAALGVAQARRAEVTRTERARLAAEYHRAFAGLPAVRTVPRRLRPGSAHHLFPVVFDLDRIGLSKRALLEFFGERRIRCQVHYTPLHRLPAFAGVPARLRSPLAVTDAAFPGLVSLPLWHGLDTSAHERVVDAVRQLVLPSGGTVRPRAERTAP